MNIILDNGTIRAIREVLASAGTLSFDLELTCKGIYMIDINFKVKENVVENNYAEFVIEPLEPGFGYTLGHAIRRVLLTSIPGAAVTSVRITGVKHRFSEVPGLKENVVDLLLNVKGLYVRIPNPKRALH